MKRKLIIVLVLLVCIAGAAFAGYKAYNKITEYKAGEEVSKELQQYIDLTATEPPHATAATQPPEETSPTEQSAQETLPPEPTETPVTYPAVDFASLLAINEDVVGWIYIEDTNINYPMVQGEDNRHYVSTMADGQVNSCGSIFLDYRNQADFSDKHTVIYGHNMRNGTMFADILKYKDPEFLAAHPTGKIMTPNGNFEFEVVAGYVAELSDPAWQLEFVSGDDFGTWLEDTMARSIIESTYIPDSNDRIITLSTCSYEFSDARFVLVCIVKG